MKGVDRMKKKEQLRRELNTAQRDIVRLQNAVRNLETENELLRGNLARLNQQTEAARTATKTARQAAEDALQAEADARDLADKLLYINDVLCAELQDCDRCIDTVRMALDQKNVRAELMNRITGPLV